MYTNVVHKLLSHINLYMKIELFFFSKYKFESLIRILIIEVCFILVF